MNNFQPVAKTIGDNVYKTTPFSAFEALKLKTKILKLISPAIGRILGSIQGKGKNVFDSKLDGEQIALALQNFFSELTEEQYEEILRKVLQNTQSEITIEGKKKIFPLNDPNSAGFDLTFKGHLLDVYKVIVFVLEVNYSDFFGLMGDFGSRFQTLLSKGAESAEEN
jgi:hypothetical protein